MGGRSLSVEISPSSILSRKYFIGYFINYIRTSYRTSWGRTVEHSTSREPTSLETSNMNNYELLKYKVQTQTVLPLVLKSSQYWHWFYNLILLQNRRIWTWQNFESYFPNPQLFSPDKNALVQISYLLYNLTIVRRMKTQDISFCFLLEKGLY